MGWGMKFTTSNIAGTCGSLFVLSLAAPSLGFSQSATGRVVGTIADAKGAVIEGTRITVTNTQTGAHFETVSGRDGSYQVLDIPIGTYTVTAQQTGFETAVTPANELQINQTLRVDVHLAVGALSQTVAVEAVAPQVETENPPSAELL
jgi:hypothetical protein